MKNKLTTILGIAVIGSATTAPSAFATNYIFGSVGLGMLSDSDNSGKFSEDFLTGEGTTIPQDTPLPAGTPLGWTTEFDNAASFSAGIGHHYGDSLRVEVELSYQKNDVDQHYGVSAAGIDLSDEDAAVLITGATNLGVSVSDVVAAGRGDVTSTSLFINALYDFPVEGPVTPYLGAGLGWSMVGVTFNPSGVGIVNDDDTVLAFQVIAGASWAISEKSDLYLGYKYRMTEDLDVKTSLFPSNLEVENAGSIIEVGMRVKF